MTNKVRMITTALLGFCALGGSFKVAWAASVRLSNATTSLTINGGETNRGKV